MSICVQFEDETLSKIRGVFGSEQDPDFYPYQGVVEESDPRYLAFIASTAPSLPSLPTAAEMVAAERYKREATGVNVEGLQIETTRDSQALIASTGLSAVLDPEYRCNFKTVTGFVEIGSAQIIAIAKEVRSHVQACFDREMTLLRAIESGEYHDEMLSQGWPDSLPPDPAELQ